MRQINFKNILSSLQHDKKRTMIGGVVVLLTIAGIIGYTLWQQRDTRTPEQKIDEVATRADKKFAEGDVDGALQVFNESIAEESNEEVKNGLLMEKSAIALSGEREQIALDAALEAEKINSTFGTTSMIAQVYDQQGNSKKAVEYYKKAIEQLDMENDPGASVDRNYFMRRITALEGGQQ